MTKKSKLGFGKNKNYTIEDLINRNKKADLVSAYYKLSSVNFTDDILFELKIKEEEKISKPGINLDIYRIVISRYPKKSRQSDSMQKMIPKTKPLTKQKLQARNHGR